MLSDSARRKVYDTWAKELEFRYVRQTSVALGGEDVLLDEFENLGLHCDPATQLVVTCEVCRRPATKECWTCKMQICEFCTLKRHWKDGVPLHWPLINSDHMRETLAKKELEMKKKEDARLTEKANPNYRTESELKDIRAFKEAAYELLKQSDRKTRYDGRIARFYMWAQTDTAVFLACKIPTGYEDRELVIECMGRNLLVQSEDSPPLIDRYLSNEIDTSKPIESLKTTDNTVCVMAFAKKEWSVAWRTLFEGDPDGSRALAPPYELYEGEDDVIMQFEVPFWIDTDDVRVSITEHDVSVHVRGCLEVKRTFWRNVEEEEKAKEYHVVLVEDCHWTLEDDVGSDGGKCKMLSIFLARPNPTEDEVKWKKGVRQDNRQAKRFGSMKEKGFRFFTDDEDIYDLEDLLQAVCFLYAGKTYVPSKPWDRYSEAKWATNPLELSPRARDFLLQAKDVLLKNEESTA